MQPTQRHRRYIYNPISFVLKRCKSIDYAVCLHLQKFDFSILSPIVHERHRRVPLKRRRCSWQKLEASRPTQEDPILLIKVRRISEGSESGPHWTRKAIRRRVSAIHVTSPALLHQFLRRGAYVYRRTRLHGREESNCVIESRLVDMRLCHYRPASAVGPAVNVRRHRLTRT